MRKLSRSKILGLVTAGAMVVTTAFSFAAWDTMNADSTGKLSIANRVAVSGTTGNTFSGTHELGTEITATEYSGTAEFDVANSADAKAAGYGLELTPSVAGLTANTDYTYTVEKAGTPLTDNKDSSYGDADNAYTVKITLKDTAAVQALAGSEAVVTVTGELTK